jgi:AcrR family transcriptional regulator
VLSNTVARPYTLKKRAEQVEQTRKRIVEAAVELHGTVGPASTTLSMIAERAGVQRHTLYAHFPTEKSLYLACSGLALERDPLPDTASWAEIRPVRDRLRRGLLALYGWYARNEELTACVLRDAEHHALTREIAELRFGPPFEAYRRALRDDLTAGQRALLAVALDFHAWQALKREAALTPAAAADLFADAIASAPPSTSMNRDGRASRRRAGRRRPPARAR